MVFPGPTSRAACPLAAAPAHPSHAGDAQSRGSSRVLRGVARRRRLDWAGESGGEFFLFFSWARAPATPLPLTPSLPASHLSPLLPPSSAAAATPTAATSAALNTLIDSARAGAFTRVLVVSGSGLSASAGMSTFSTKGGLYDRAARAARLPPGDGKKLFSWPFFERRRGEALAFLAGVAAEAAAATPTPAHAALASLARAGALERHFTLNIDGLARAAGLSTWHTEDAQGGETVELHGCVGEVVCPDCGRVGPATPALLAACRARTDTPCPACTAGPLRPRVLLYGDAEDGVITPSSALDLLEASAVGADLVLWVGISFEQSASAAYFRDVRRALAAAGRGPRGVEGSEGSGREGSAAASAAAPPRPPPVQAIINPAASDAAFNLATALHYSEELGSVLEVSAPADAVLPPLVAAIAAGLGRPEALVVGPGTAPAVVPRPPSAAVERHGTLAASEGGEEEEGEEAEEAAGVGGPVKGGGGGTAVTADARVA